MKPADQILQRLLNAAAQAPPPAPGPAPFGLETRLLAQWRAADEADETDLVFAFFRRAVVCACLVLLLSAVWSLTRPTADVAANEVALANYSVNFSLWP